MRSAAHGCVECEPACVAAQVQHLLPPAKLLYEAPTIPLICIETCLLAPTLRNLVLHAVLLNLHCLGLLQHQQVTLRLAESACLHRQRVPVCMLRMHPAHTAIGGLSSIYYDLIRQAFWHFWLFACKQLSTVPSQLRAKAGHDLHTPLCSTSMMWRRQKWFGR